MTKKEIELCRSLEVSSVEPYYDNLVPGAMFFASELASVHEPIE